MILSCVCAAPVIATDLGGKKKKSASIHWEKGTVSLAAARAVSSSLNKQKCDFYKAWLPGEGKKKVKKKKKSIFLLQQEGQVSPELDSLA